jgi:hypothetical protein
MEQTKEANMASGSRLLRALKSRYASPAAVLKKLGIDAALIRDEAVSSGMPSLPAATELHNLLASRFSHIKDDEEVGRMFELVEELADERRKAGDHIPRKIETMPEQNMGAHDDEHDDHLEPFREHLRDHGLSEDEVEEAAKLGRDFIRNRRSNGHDRRPLPAAGHGGFGGHISGRSKDADLRQAREHMARIESEPTLDRRRGAMDAKPKLAPSRAERARINAAYPDSARLLDVSGAPL